MNLRPVLLVLLLSVPLLAAGAVPAAPSARTYAGAGTVVTSFELGTGTARIEALDNGAVVCRDADRDGFYESGSGGVCIPFEQLGGDAVYVHDETVPDRELSFQVCVDNNGDGVCSGDGERGAYQPGICNDRIYFSHSSFGGNVNPLFVNPANTKSYWAACNKGGFPGYVVIVCAGAHNDFGGGNPHTHQATRGVVTGAFLGGNTGGGDFCGGVTAAKAYRVVSG